MSAKVIKGDCLEIIKSYPSNHFDMIYFDPPFFTQKIQTLGTRTRDKIYSFKDIWNSLGDYSDFIVNRLIEFHRVLKKTGTVFFHCDKNASHIARLCLDNVFGQNMFKSEIIWHYRRWSNSQKNLLPSHQIIYFYSKTNKYKFNEFYQDYSPSTNIDQILQLRQRDKNGKAVYAKDKEGNIIINGVKKGVPLTDVWDIPYLNPKARERTGYPTQKPLNLLERIILISTDKNDLILDPFCGSGTTLVAAERLERDSVGIDISNDAIDLTQERLKSLIKSESGVLNKGRESYNNADKDCLEYLKGLDFIPIQRNKGIDAILKVNNLDRPIIIKIQRQGETILDAASKLEKASREKKPFKMILVATNKQPILFNIDLKLDENLIIIDATSYAIKKRIEEILQKSINRNLETHFEITNSNHFQID